MRADALGDAHDPQAFAKIDGQAPGAGERIPVELEPGRTTAARKPPVGNDDVHHRASRRERVARVSTWITAEAEADDEPGRKLSARRLEDLFQLLVKRGKPRLPIAPSTLWKRRFPYVRGARPLHCN